jgi:hypothetical protein
VDVNSTISETLWVLAAVVRYDKRWTNNMVLHRLCVRRWTRARSAGTILSLRSGRTLTGGCVEGPVAAGVNSSARVSHKAPLCQQKDLSAAVLPGRALWNSRVCV